jgi:hypothetical protein
MLSIFIFCELPLKTRVAPKIVIYGAIGLKIELLQKLMFPPKNTQEKQDVLSF